MIWQIQPVRSCVLVVLLQPGAKILQRDLQSTDVPL